MIGWRMTYPLLWAQVVLCCCIFLGVLSHADAGELMLINGDRLTGEIVRKDTDAIVLKTDYAGEITVAWDAVRCVATGREHKIVFGDERELTGKIICPKDGAFQVVGAGGIGPEQPLSELALLNPPPAVRYRGNVVGGGSAAGGNTNTSSYYVSGRFELRSERHRFAGIVKGNYSESNDTVTAQNASGSFKYDRFFTKRLYAYGQTLLEQDQLQDLDLRATIGAGIGYQIIDTEKAEIFIEGGLSYVDEVYDIGENRNYIATRWGAGVDWEIIKDRVAFFHRQAGYVSLKDPDDWFLRTEQGFRLPLIQDFFTNLQYDYEYTNRPAPGKTNTDTRFIIGLGYEFRN